MTNPNYYAIIPASVRYNKDLSANAKLLYGEISALANTKGYCFANNRYFADLFEVSTFAVSRWISQLEECGHIKTEIIYNGKQITERRIYLAESQYLLTKSARPIDENGNTPIDKNGNTPIDKNGKDNNTSIFNTTSMNNTVNNNNNKNTTTIKESTNSINNNPPLSPLVPSGENETLFVPELEAKFMEWIRYKKEQHRFTYKPVALKSLRRQIERHLESHTPEQIIEIIDLSIASGYKGILFDRLDAPRNNQSNKSGSMDFVKIAQEMAKERGK